MGLSICLGLWQKEKGDAHACSMNTANAPALLSAASWSARCASALLRQHLLATCNMRKNAFWAFEDLLMKPRRRQSIHCRYSEYMHSGHSKSQQQAILYSWRARSHTKRNEMLHDFIADYCT